MAAPEQQAGRSFPGRHLSCLPPGSVLHFVVRRLPTGLAFDDGHGRQVGEEFLRAAESADAAQPDYLPMVNAARHSVSLEISPFTLIMLGDVAKEAHSPANAPEVLGHPLGCESRL
jgi:hypothetical protein